MPTLEQIQQFNESLVRLGGEPEVLSERGESIPEIAPPTAEISAELQELLAEGPEDLPAPPTDVTEELQDELHGELDELDLGALGVDAGPDVETPDMGLGPLTAEEPAAAPETADLPEAVEQPEEIDQTQETDTIPSFEDLGFDTIPEDADLGALLQDETELPAEPDLGDASTDFSDLLGDEAETPPGDADLGALLQDETELPAEPDLGDASTDFSDLLGDEAETPLGDADLGALLQDETELPTEPDLGDATFDLEPEQEVAAPAEDMGLPDLGDIDLGSFDLGEDDATASEAGESLPEEPELPGLDDLLGESIEEPDFSLPSEDLPAEADLAAPGDAVQDQDLATQEDAATLDDEFSLPVDEEPEAGEPEEAEFGLPDLDESSLSQDFVLPEGDESPDLAAEDALTFPEMPETETDQEQAAIEPSETDFGDEMPELATPEETEALLGNIGDEEPVPPDQEADAFSMPDVDWGEAPALPEIDALEPESIEFTMPGESEDESVPAMEMADFSLPEEDVQPTSPEAFGEPSSEEDFVIDEFALPGVDSLDEEEPAAPTPEDVAPEVEPDIDFGVPETEVPAPAQEGPEPEYSNREFAAIQRSLSQMPLSLRIAVEQQIGGDRLTGEPLRRLLDALIRGAAPVQVAAALEAATGITIDLPRRLERSSGLAFQRQRRSVGYLFRYSVLPRLRVFLLVAAVLVAMIFGARQFVLIPLRANRLYRAGYEELVADRYTAADSAFDQARGVLPIKRWYHDYAGTFREKKQLESAEDKYLELIKRWGPEQAAVLAYANMLTFDQRRFAEAEQQLKGFLETAGNQLDYDGLLALGDNYMEWADDDPDKYQKAGEAYDRVLKTQTKDSEEPWFRLMRYYIRSELSGETDAESDVPVDHMRKVDSIKARFDQARKLEIDPSAYAELAGYYVTRNKLGSVRDILTEAMEVDQRVPEVYYQFARYFRAASDPVNEEAALDFALDEYLDRKGEENLTRREKRHLIQTLGRKAQVLFEREEYVKADETYAEATRRIEEGMENGAVKPTEEFGEIYAGRGDIHYYVSGDLERAMALYEKAGKAGQTSTDLDYKIGYIHYRREERQDALLAFHGVTESLRDNPSALYALANTLYLRGDYYAAQGFYSHLVDQLENRRGQIEFLRPEENPDHLDLLEITMRTYNNLGVTMKRLSENVRDPDKESEALVYLTRSLEYFDRVSRNPESLARGEARNLAYLNSRGITYPQSNFVLQIYREIPKNLDKIRF